MRYMRLLLPEKGVLRDLNTLYACLLVLAFLAISAGGCAGRGGKAGANPVPSPTPESLSSQAIKIVVDQEGLYKIPEKELKRLLFG